MRADTRRFPRAVVNRAAKEAFSYPGAMPKPVLSVFSPRLLAADRAAFTELMRHLAIVDPGHVVVMVQVENEMGLLRDKPGPLSRRGSGLAAAGAAVRHPHRRDGQRLGRGSDQPVAAR